MTIFPSRRGARRAMCGSILAENASKRPLAGETRRQQFVVVRLAAYKVFFRIVPVSRFRSSHAQAAIQCTHFGIKRHWQTIDLVWLWFRSPHDRVRQK